MVLSKKEYEEMKRLREVGIKYENKYNDLNKKVEDFKTYLRVKIKMLDMVTDDTKIMFLYDILGYLEKN